MTGFFWHIAVVINAHTDDSWKTLVQPTQTVLGRLGVPGLDQLLTFVDDWYLEAKAMSFSMFLQQRNS